MPPPDRPRASRRRFSSTLPALPLLGAAPSLRAQTWPSRPIRIMCPSAAGGLLDQIGRLIADRLGRDLKTPVVVENRPGGTGSVALDAIAKAPADGYTIGIGFSGGNIIYPLLNPKLPFDARRDFSMLGMIGIVSNLLVVQPDLPPTDLASFITWVKAQPTPPPYASWGNGSGGHLAGEYLKMLTGIDMYHVPYRSMTALATDLLGGHMKIAFADASSLPLVLSGKLRAIAQVGPRGSPLLPQVRTMKEQGVAFDTGSWIALIGPAGMPAPIAGQLNAELNKILQDPALNERWISILGTTPMPSTPAAMEQTLKTDWDVWKSVIDKAHIVLE